ncbi:MAG: hypothetical protein KAH07_02890 [Flavobacteriaceae bacterium]|nr:hypothetical protein [Flavobacteriaceae bacterium]
MKSKTLTIVFLLFGIIFQSNAQSDNDGNWIVIAKKDVAYKKGDNDKITPYGSERNVSKIKVKCTQGTLKLKKVHVTMDDGTKKEYSAKGVGVLNKGMSSFAFDLPGKDKKLKTIEIEYDAVGNVLLTKRAKVEILGKKRKD